MRETRKDETGATSAHGGAAGSPPGVRPESRAESRHLEGAPGDESCSILDLSWTSGVGGGGDGSPGEARAAELHRRYEQDCAEGGVLPFEVVLARHPSLGAELARVHEERVIDLYRELERAHPSPSAEDVARIAARHPWAEGELMELLEASEALRGLSGALGLGGPEAYPDVSADAGEYDPFTRTTAAHPSIGRYRLTRELGRGGYGRVFLAWDAALRRSVALKVMDPARASFAELRERFLQEAQVASQLDHPCAPAVHDVGLTPRGVPFFAMQYVKGESLARWLSRRRPRAEGEDLLRAVRALVEVCGLVHYALTAKKLEHRDLKPDNVMLEPGGRVYVLDWGLSHARGRPGELGVREEGLQTEVALSDRRLRSVFDAEQALRTRAGVPIGTAHYIAPERLQPSGDTDGARADVYSIGAMLYEVLAGSAPYSGVRTGGSLRQFLRHIEQQPPAPLSIAAPGRDGALVSIAERAMARAPEDRHGSARELGRALQRWLEAASPQPVAAQRGPERPGRSGVRLALALGVAAAAGLWLGRLLG